MKKFFYAILFTVACSFGLTACVDDDPLDSNYYTFTGEMVTDYLENRDKEFSEYIKVLKRANLWDMLSSYGKYTCFAPTNDAMKDYYRTQGISGIDQLSDADCDTLAWQHLVKATYFISDLGEGSLPTTNLNNRYLTYSLETEGNVTHHYMNTNSELIARDDTVQNGVVHTLSRVLSSSSIFLGDAIVADSACKIFGQALLLTGLKDSLALFQDDRYYCSPDSTTLSKTSQHHRIFGGNDVYWKYPAVRKLMWTVFVEPDSIFNRYKIYDLDDLKAYAKRIYDETYPEDAGRYDNDFANRRNPLNRFVAYHILDRYAPYSELTVSGTVWPATVTNFRPDVQDIMEFYETYAPYTILKVCDAGSHKWVNRKGLGDRYKVKGCRIYTPSEIGHKTDHMNGLYHFIDNILTYNKKETIDQVLNCRMRMDATTLSPDFMNAGARNSDPATYDVSHFMMGFKSGFTKNFIFSENTFFGVHNRFWNLSWESDMCACLDNFDIKFRIPPVPSGQTYEVRLGYAANPARTVVQVYFDDNLTGDMPCGIPVDLRKMAGQYGWVKDSDLGSREEIEANDKALRNQGYMKGTAAATFPDGNLARDTENNIRRILTTQYFEEGHDYYIRLRQVLENQAEMSLDYIEVVPKSVYDGPVAEDWY